MMMMKIATIVLLGAAAWFIVLGAVYVGQAIAN